MQMYALGAQNGIVPFMGVSGHEYISWRSSARIANYLGNAHDSMQPYRKVKSSVVCTLYTQLAR